MEKVTFVVRSKSFRLSRTPLDYRSECEPGYEGHEPGDSVPHFAPDQNPFVDEFMKLYHLPREAVLGYRETLYPAAGTPAKKGAKGKDAQVPELSYAYAYRFTPLMEQRLSQSGVRLAAYLNWIFAEPQVLPERPAR